MVISSSTMEMERAKGSGCACEGVIAWSPAGGQGTDYSGGELTNTCMLMHCHRHGVNIMCLDGIDHREKHAN